MTRFRYKNWNAFQSTCQLKRCIQKAIYSNLQPTARPQRFVSSSTSHSSAHGLFGFPILSRPEGIVTATHDAIEKANRIVERVLAANTLTEMKETVGLLDTLSDTLCSVVDTAECLRNISSSQELVDSCHEACAILHNYLSQLNTHEGLFQAISRTLNDPDVKHVLNPQERRVAELLKYDFEKSGIHLPKQVRERFIKLNDELNQLGQAFLENSGSRESYIKLSDPSKSFDGIPNLPKSFLNRTDKTGAVQIPTISEYSRALLKHSRDPETRKKVYLAMNSGSDQQQLILDALLTRRVELAHLLGHESYRQYFLQDKMAKTPQVVDTFLSQLASDNLIRVKEKVSHMNRMKQIYTNHSNEPLMAWDVPFFSRYISDPMPQQMTDSEISSYFPLSAVINGLSQLLTSLFGVSLVERKIPKSEVWHPEVLRYDIIHERDGRLGTIYMDLYERQKGELPKFDGAAHFTIQCGKRVSYAEQQSTSLLKRNDDDFHNHIFRTESRSKFKYQLPVVALVMHFKRPRSSDLPTTLTLNEIETLFHEMGHAIHSMLGITDFQHISGTRVVMDFVEVPSTLLELFAKSPHVLSAISSHFETKQKLPVSVLQAHRMRRKLLHCLDMQDQLMMAMMDQAYHSNMVVAGTKNMSYLDVIPKQIQENWHIIPYPEGASPHLQFTHLVSYGASYYTYFWSKRWAGRIFSTFFDPILSQDRCESWKDVLRTSGEMVADEVLRVAGSRDPWIGLERLGVVREGEREGTHYSHTHDQSSKSYLKEIDF